MLTLEDLGVLRSVEEYDDRVVVTITPTYSGCPAMATMRDDLVHRLSDAGFDAEVRVSLAPAWSSDWITERGRQSLVGHGISAPGAAPAGSRRPLAAADAACAHLPALRCGRRGADLGVRADGVQGDVPLHLLPRAVRAREGDLMVSTAPERTTRGAFHTLTVASVERLCDDAVAVTFDVPDELRAAYDFEAGQSLTLRRIIDGEDHRRDYSICAQVGERPRVGVRLIPGGRFSEWLVNEVRPGDQVEVQTPRGSFRAAPDGGRHLCIAAGSGITPMMSIASTVLSHPDSRLTLLYGNRTTSSVMFAEELADLKNRYGARLDLVHVLSREPRDVELFSGRLEGDRLRRLLDHAGPARRGRPRVAVRAVRDDRGLPRDPRAAGRGPREGALRAVLRRRAAAGGEPARGRADRRDEQRDRRTRRAEHHRADAQGPDHPRRRPEDARRPAVRVQGRRLRHLPGSPHLGRGRHAPQLRPRRRTRSSAASCSPARRTRSPTR